MANEHDTFILGIPLNKVYCSFMMKDIVLATEWSSDTM